MDNNKVEITYAQAAIVMARLSEKGEEITLDRLRNLFADQLDDNTLKNYCEKWHQRQQEYRPESFPLSSQSGITLKNRPSEVDELVNKRTKELEESLALVRATLESTADGILIINNEGQLVDWNDKFIEIMRTNEQTMRQRDEGGGIAKLLAQIENPEEFIGLMQYVYQNPEATGNMGNLNFKDGRIVERYSQPHRINNKIVGRVWSFRDITRQVKSQEILKLREKVIDASINGIAIIEAHPPYPITYINPAIEQLTEFNKSDLLGQPFSFVLNNNSNNDKVANIQNAIESEQSAVISIKNKRKNGSEYWTELHISPVPSQDGIISHHVIVMLDITEKKANEEKIIHRANHDYLTELPNRNYFLSKAEKFLAEDPNKKRAIIFFDLDHFKFINDRLGHVFGDALLLKVTERLTERYKNRYILSRFGGDEFVMFIDDFQSIEHVELISQEILDIISNTVDLNGQAVNTTASAGVSIYPEHGQSISDLLVSSDIAMYQAKEDGRNCYYIYNAELRDKIAIKMIIENSLHTALKNEQFNLVYQPIFDLDSQRALGAECLIRWKHPELGMVSPEKFIPMAEFNGEINEIGLWVIDKACETFANWSKEYDIEFISINISTRQLQSPTFDQDVFQVINKYNLEPKNIELELTEGIFIDDSNVLIENIFKLKSLGIKLSIDDFGTGFSNFSYLKRFQIDKVKIDRSFISKMQQDLDCEDKTISKSIINLGRDLGLLVVAEGIENSYQQHFLIENKCHQGQGYHLGRPMSKSEFEKKIFKN